MAASRYPMWRYLAGFVSEGEAWAYVTGQGVKNSPEDELKLRKEIQSAGSFVASLPDRSDISPRMSALPDSARERLSKLEAEPTFKEQLQGIKSHEWTYIELAKLRCFQQNLNMEYVQDLVERVPNQTDLEAVLRFCLPLMSERPKTEIPIGFNPTTNTYTIVSENLDFRILGTVGGEAQDPNGTKRPFVGFLYGFGLPQLSVAEYRGAYVIKNGYHRAYALLEAGHTRAPVLLVHAASYAAVGGAIPGFLPADLVLSSKPAVLPDFRTPAAVDVPRRRMRIVISVHGEAQIIGA